jgi:hypothetical protein
MSGALAVVIQTEASLNFFNLSSGERTAHMSSYDGPNPRTSRASPGQKEKSYTLVMYITMGTSKSTAINHHISVIDPLRKGVVDVIDISSAIAPHGLALDAERDILSCSYEDNVGDERGGVTSINLTFCPVVKGVESLTKTH